MRTYARMIAFGMMIIGGVILASWNEAVAANPFTCDNHTAKGSFGFNFTGFFFPTPVTAVPESNVGIVTTDGKGSLTASGTFSIGGNVVAQQLTGTYAVDSDCTLTATFTNVATNAVNHLAGVIVEGGDAAYLTFTDQGFTSTGTLKRIGSLLFDRD